MISLYKFDKKKIQADMEVQSYTHTLTHTQTFRVTQQCLPPNQGDFWGEKKKI